MSFNSPKGEQFIKRTANYSTHGSRRGFVDDGTYVESKDTDRKALIHNIALINEQIANFRQKYRIPPKRSIPRLFRKGTIRARIPVDTYNAICDLIKYKNELQEDLISTPKPKRRKQTLTGEMLNIYRETYGVSDETHRTIRIEALKRLEDVEKK